MDRIKSVITIILWILLLVSFYAALSYRGQAIKAKYELESINLEGKIDDPYGKVIADKNRQIKELRKDKAAKQVRIDKLVKTLTELEQQHGIINSAYGELVKNKPKKAEVKNIYDEADVKSVCDYFIARGVPCEVISR